MRKREGHTRLLSTIIAFLLVFVSIFAGQNLKDIKAAQTANISISSASATVGESVTVTLTISASSEVYATQLYLSYDTNILQYVSGSADTSGAGTLGLVNTDTFTSKSFNFTFKIVGVGTSSVSVTGNTRLIDGNEEDMTVSSSKGSVTGKAAANYSSDNTLKSLKISPGVLSPAFSSSTTYYTTSVDADVETLVVNAVANDANATVSVKYANLDMGANETYVVVTAQNGDTKTYTIATTRGDATETENTTEEESQSETEEIVEREVSIDGTIQLYDANYFVASDAADVSKAEAKGMVSKAYKWYFYLSLFCLAVVLLAAIIIISILSVRLSKLGANKDESEEDEPSEAAESSEMAEPSKVAEPSEEDEPSEEIELTEIDKDEK
ncbi:cadherin-like beta sandwich domain-containing protein [Lachnospira sp.]|jgi:hypothetical protein|uniref:cadherin-like beta sandwich domain-containing protein n=1 Tax=Lachnospira sp. TaxID=2049031 RepID=UPI00257A81CC|nr:cadherin-like beta sandwich domain-containing protein [Lachnospira sp.]